MKKIVLFTVSSIFLISCGPIMRTASGSTEKNLIKTVSIEQECAIENIEILDKVKRSGGATYSLSACGSKVVYKQVGSLFMEAEEADKMVESLKN